MVALCILFFLILLFYLERKMASRRAGLSATAEFLVRIAGARFFYSLSVTQPSLSKH